MSTIRPLLPMAALVLASSFSVNVSAGNMLAYFKTDDKKCPDGWSRYEPAEGRLMRATTDKQQVGKVDGTSPMLDGEPFTHTHTFEYTLTKKKGPDGVGGADKNPSHPGKESTKTYTTNASNGNLPYAYLLVCREDKPEQTNAAQHLEKSMVALFDGDCPASGWRKYELLNNSFLVGRPSQFKDTPAKRTSGSTADNGHDHYIRFKTGKGGENSDVVHANVPTTTSPTTIKWPNTKHLAKNEIEDAVVLSERSSANAPIVYVMACEKIVDAEGDDIELVQESIGGMVSAMGAANCPTDWHSLNDFAGRYLVGLPKYKDYTHFGSGEGLEPGKRREHRHYVKFDTSLNRTDKATIFNGGSDLAKSDTEFDVQGHTDWAPSAMPFIMLTLCQMPEPGADVGEGGIK